MFLSTAAIVSMLTSDFLEARMPPSTPDTETAYSVDGEGELLVSFTPSGTVGSVARGATRVPFGTLNFSASCTSEVRIDSVTLKHIGLGGVSDISRVYLSSGFRRISRARPFDSRSGLAELRTPSLVIPACGAMRATVLLDLSSEATVASEHAVAFESALSVQSTAKTVTVSQDESESFVRASPVSAGSVTVNFLPIQGRIGYGRTETIARIQISADAENSYLLKGITLTNQESAHDMDFRNLRLEKRDGTPVTPLAARMKGKTVSLEFSPTYILDRSKTIVLLLRADVHATNYRKVNFFLEEPSDFWVTIYRPERK